jgi:hypothetical protein
MRMSRLPTSRGYSSKYRLGAGLTAAAAAFRRRRFRPVARQSADISSGVEASS